MDLTKLTFCIEERNDIENILDVLEADVEKTNITSLSESFVPITPAPVQTLSPLVRHLRSPYRYGYFLLLRGIG